MVKNSHSKKPAKNKTLDDFLDDLAEAHSHNLKESFAQYDEFTSEDNTNHLFNNILHPAQDELYNTFAKELERIGEDETKNLHKKKKELEKATVTALKEYFKKAFPFILKSLEDVPEEDHYEILTRAYDDHVGVGKIKGVTSIRALVEGHASHKNATIGGLKRIIYDHKSKYATGAYQLLLNQLVNHHFVKYHPQQVGAYVKRQLGKHDLEIDDHVAFMTKGKEEYIALHGGLKTGQMPEGGYDAFGLKKKEKKSEEHEHDEHGHH